MAGKPMAGRWSPWYYVSCRGCGFILFWVFFGFLCLFFCTTIGWGGRGGGGTQRKEPRLRNLKISRMYLTLFKCLRPKFIMETSFAEHAVKEKEKQCQEECGVCYNRFSVAVFVLLVFRWTYSWGAREAEMPTSYWLLQLVLIAA